VLTTYHAAHTLLCTRTTQFPPTHHHPETKGTYSLKTRKQGDGGHQTELALKWITTSTSSSSSSTTTIYTPDAKGWEVYTDGTATLSFLILQQQQPSQQQQQQRQQQEKQQKGGRWGKGGAALTSPPPSSASPSYPTRLTIVRAVHVDHYEGLTAPPPPPPLLLPGVASHGGELVVCVCVCVCGCVSSSPSTERPTNQPNNQP
jgi:hypothetical protein